MILAVTSIYPSTGLCVSRSLAAGERETYTRILPLRQGRRPWQRPWVRPQLFEDQVDGAVELLIDAGVFLGGVVVDDDVGIDAVAFDHPVLAGRIVGGELGLVEIAAVEEGQRAA